MLTSVFCQKSLSRCVLLYYPGDRHELRDLVCHLFVATLPFILCKIICISYVKDV